MFDCTNTIHMYYNYIISLKNKCRIKAECDNGIALKVTNQTDPSIKNCDIDITSLIILVSK